MRSCPHGTVRVQKPGKSSRRNPIIAVMDSANSLCIKVVGLQSRVASSETSSPCVKRMTGADHQAQSGEELPK